MPERRDFGAPILSLPPARAEYVRAIAASLARTGDAGRAVEPVRAEARRRLARRAALPEDAGDHALRAAAERAGLTEPECRALLEPGDGEGEAIDAGRALAKLAEGGR